MSFKKIGLMGVAGVAAMTMTAVMAGGPVQEPVAVNDSGFYLEGHLGYARQNYFDNENWIQSSALPGVGTNLNNNSNVNGGFAGGVDAGYQINRHFAAELGWFGLPSVNVMQAGTPSAYLTSWALYLAAKYMMPLPWMNSTDAYFKLGAEYRQVTMPSAALAANGGYNTSSSQSTYVRPMFATGVNYNFSKAWAGVIQYAYFMGANNSFPYVAPTSGALGTVAANVFTLGLGYHFN